MSNALIECRNLSVKYGKRTVLRNISLSVQSGEIISVIGPNGSGKSTLFRALIGAVNIASGSVEKSPDLRIGYVPQKLHIDETFPLTVERFMKLPSNPGQRVISETLTLTGANGLEKKQVSQLSGGQFQRVLLARALLGSPNLLLLDEATRGLDFRGTAAFYRLVDDIRKRLGCAVLMISHELHVVMKQTDHVICINQSICCEGEPEIIKESPAFQSLFGLLEDTESALYLHHHEDGPQSAREAENAG